MTKTTKLTAPQRRCLKLLVGRNRPTRTATVGALLWGTGITGKHYRYTRNAFQLLDRLNGMSPLPLVSCRIAPYAESYEWEITEAGRAALAREEGGTP